MAAEPGGGADHCAGCDGEGARVAIHPDRAPAVCPAFKEDHPGERLPRPEPQRSSGIGQMRRVKARPIEDLRPGPTQAQIQIAVDDYIVEAVRPVVGDEQRARRDGDVAAAKETPALQRDRPGRVKAGSRPLIVDVAAQVDRPARVAERPQARQRTVGDNIQRAAVAGRQRAGVGEGGRVEREPGARSLAADEPLVEQRHRPAVGAVAADLGRAAEHRRGADDSAGRDGEGARVAIHPDRAPAVCPAFKEDHPGERLPRPEPQRSSSIGQMRRVKARPIEDLRPGPTQAQIQIAVDDYIVEAVRPVVGDEQRARRDGDVAAAKETPALQRDRPGRVKAGSRPLIVDVAAQVDRPARVAERPQARQRTVGDNIQRAAVAGRQRAGVGEGGRVEREPGARSLAADEPLVEQRHRPAVGAVAADLGRAAEHRRGADDSAGRDGEGARVAIHPDRTPAVCPAFKEDHPGERLPRPEPQRSSGIGQMRRVKARPIEDLRPGPTQAQIQIAVDDYIVEAVRPVVGDEQRARRDGDVAAAKKTPALQRDRPGRVKAGSRPLIVDVAAQVDRPARVAERPQARQRYCR